MRLIKLLTCIIVLLVLVNVTLANRSLDQSLVMVEVQQEIIKLEKDQSILNAEIASKGSLATLEPKIKEAGFVSPTQVMAVRDQVSSVALR